MCLCSELARKNDGKVFGDDQEGLIALPVIDGKSVHVSVESENQDSDLKHMIEAVKRFHLKNGFDIGTQSQQRCFTV
ncbi:hypothetical protein [Desulfosporosinus metallidurans]|uniref:Uncharacterized protein n=1 Tax=Desulfosporosinus metallidurans TaxID=1888891 RepID=A0A1Q8QZJ5_9FIRM|nr:hypothetical protein [Desulfosporosinus metallidurans]OLN32610.1 hypothetical protein DSOL_1361 [Desulfosporosinus metallidurans]